MNSVSLIYTFPDGSKKFWRGIVDRRRGDVVLEYGGDVRRVRQTIIEKDKLKKSTPELELEWRAQEKLRKGYVHLQIEQDDENDIAVSPTALSSIPAKARMDRMLALVGAGDCDENWFF